uniref:Uncharacterized protein n=1 Tax=Meloidogyne enterolobii TaxID=390850 RepID=A0A6V7TZB5_MELEN|nr:unnamed protein product [Meloidogyne enterolobii]
MDEQLEKKFKNGFKKPIPLYLSGHGVGEDLILEKVDKAGEYILQLPPIIQSKEVVVQAKLIFREFQQQNAQEADQLQNKQETTKLNGEQQNFLLFWKKKDDEGKNMREYF